MMSVNSNYKWKAIREKDLSGNYSITNENGTVFVKEITVAATSAASDTLYPFISLYAEPSTYLPSPSFPISVNTKTALGNKDKYWDYGYISNIYSSSIWATSVRSNSYWVGNNSGKILINQTKTTAAANDYTWNSTLLERFVSGSIASVRNKIVFPDSSASRGGTIGFYTYSFTFDLLTEDPGTIIDPTFKRNGTTVYNFTKNQSGTVLTYTSDVTSSGRLNYTSEGGYYYYGYSSPAKSFRFEPYLYPCVENHEQSVTLVATSSVVVSLENPSGLTNYTVSNIGYGSDLTSVTYNSSTQEFTVKRSSGSGTLTTTFTYTLSGTLPPKFYIFENGSWVRTYDRTLNVNLTLTSQ